MTISAASAGSYENKIASARFNMVENQIRTNRVTDPDLLAALTKVPREVFVPPAMASVAYVDAPIRVARGRFLMEPLDLARLLQEAGVTPRDKVLVVGPATGYSVAVLAQLSPNVTAVEEDSELASAARVNLEGLKLSGVSVAEGPLTQGWPAGAPFDVILVEGMVAEMPEAICAQLGEGGRLVTIQAQEGPCATGMLFRNLGGAVSGRILFDAAGSFLPGFEPKFAFSL